MLSDVGELPRRIRRELRGLFSCAAAGGIVLCSAAAGADQLAGAPAEGESLPHGPPPRRAAIQYGVAFTVEGVASAGPICNDSSNPCILGSGGGIAIRVGLRRTEDFYIGGAYELSKQDASKLYLLGTLQQARLEVRHYFPTGHSVEPFVLVGVGLAGYGNEWSIDTWGPSAALGGGVEVELSGGALLNAALLYRPIYLHSFGDSSALEHPAGVAQFIGLEIALEAQDTL
jgi:hypothetical protein